MTFGELVTNVLASSGVTSALIGTVAYVLKQKYDLKLKERLTTFKSTLNKEQADFQNALDQKLQSHISNLDRKNYISKTRFDAEFQIYRDLSKTFLDMINELSDIRPPSFYDNLIGLNYLPEKPRDARCLSAREKIEVASETLHRNLPFIQKEFYDKYDDILKPCHQQFHLLTPIFSTEKRTAAKQWEDCNDYDKRLQEINRNFFILNDSIREYLFNLEIIE